ncbi:MAG: protein kinase [Pseudonocardiales bacterium]
MALHGLRPDDPAKLGPYELRGRLGAGGMGVVYLGFAPDGEAVAVKSLPGAASADSRERMRREARVLRSLNFPRVAGLVAADTDAATPWLALPYISGPSLLEAATPLRDAPLRQFAHGLAEALAVLHGAGVTHRDVKPANVILTFDGPVLVDLGIARTEDMATMTQAGTVIGSVGWMSPEQLHGKAAGPASDVWGWGAVVVYAATGRAPFGEGTLEALAWRIQSHEPDLEGVPDWLLPALRRALVKDPAARPPARELFAATESRAPAFRAAVPAPAIPAAPTIPVGPQNHRPPSGPSVPPYRPQHNPPPPVYRARAPGPPAARSHTGVIVTVAVLALVGVLALVAVVVATLNSDSTLAAPANFKAVVTPTAVGLSWDKVKSADHYAVYRDEKVIDETVPGTTYSDPAGATGAHTYAVAAVTSSGKEGDKSPKVPTVPDTSPGDSPSPSTSSASLSAADEALANRLPSEVADSTTCIHYAGFSSAATIASLSCATATGSVGGTAPARIYAYQDSSAAAFHKHFGDLTANFTPVSTDCDKPPARDIWHFNSDKNTVVGALLCYTDTAVKKPTIQWTYDAAGIAVVAVAADQDATALKAWWDDVGLTLG